MPLQIFCTISFSNEEAPRDATAAGRGENGADEFLYGQEEEEEEEEDAGAATDLVAFASSCTLHGLSHIFVEGSLGARQALWAVAFLLSLSVFLYQVADRIVYYLEYHHVTLLSEEDSPEMTFPAVTFCNINRVRVSQLSHEDLLYLAPLVDYEPGMELGFVPAQFSSWDEDEPLNLHGFFNRTCHQLEDMLLSCSYQGEQCGPGDFVAVSSPILLPWGLDGGTVLLPGTVISWLLSPLTCPTTAPSPLPFPLPGTAQCDEYRVRSLGWGKAKPWV